MGAPYETINGTEMGSNLAYIFTYVNSVTNGFATLFMTIAFYLIVLITSLLAQFRFSGTIKPETSFAAASYAGLGFIVILSGVNGLIDPLYVITAIGLCAISTLWLILNKD